MVVEKHRCPTNTPPEPHVSGSGGQQRSAEQCRSLRPQNETDRYSSCCQQHQDSEPKAEIPMRGQQEKHPESHSGKEGRQPIRGEFLFADRLAAELKNMTDLLKASPVAAEEEVVCVDRSAAGRRNRDVQDSKASASNAGDLSSSFAAPEALPVHAPFHHHHHQKSCYPRREEQAHQPKHPFPKEPGAFYHHENERRFAKDFSSGFSRVVFERRPSSPSSGGVHPPPLSAQASALLRLLSYENIGTIF